MHIQETSALERYVPVSARRVLDCGCGDGARAEALAARGAEVVAIHAPGVEGPAVRGVVETLTLSASLPRLPEDVGRFDAIVCDDTLARLRDPAPLLMQFVHVLEPGGLLIATAPNLQHHANVVSLVNGRWTYGEEGALARPHLRFFTNLELARLLEGCGFSQVKCAALRADEPALFQRDEEGYVHRGRMVIGPLNDVEYRGWLAREYLLLAVR